MTFSHLLMSVLATLGAVFLTSCGASDEGTGVGGVTEREAEALNEAAEMLDERNAEAEAALGNDKDS